MYIYSYRGMIVSVSVSIQYGFLKGNSSSSTDHLECIYSIGIRLQFQQVTLEVNLLTGTAGGMLVT